MLADPTTRDDAAQGPPAPTIPVVRGVAPLPLIGAALAAFALGTAVYVLDRAPGAITLLPPHWTGVGAAGATFGALGGALPSFAHSFAFALLTALVAGGTGRSRALVCLAWGAIGVAFEAGQHPWLAASLVETLRGPLAAWPAAGALARYFAHGTFDVADVVATVAGASLAAGLIALATRAAIRRTAVRHATVMRAAMSRAGIAHGEGDCTALGVPR